MAGHLPVVEWLLENGAPVDALSEAGTPLLWAAGSGQQHVVKELLRAGANADALGTDGVSATLMASAAGTVCLLCSHGHHEARLCKLG